MTSSRTLRFTVIALIAASLLLLLASSVYAARRIRPDSQLEGWVDVTEENFDSVVSGDVNVLVEFYAPWCPHCKHAVRELEKLGRVFSKSHKGRDFKLAKINGDAVESLTERYNVEGFPTVMLFKKGGDKTQPVEYDGPIKARKLLDFLLKESKKPVSSGSTKTQSAADTEVLMA